MGLPYDVSRCAVTHENYHCPLAHHCARRIDKGRAEYQPFTAFKGGADCDGFIDAYTLEDKDKERTNDQEPM